MDTKLRIPSATSDAVAREGLRCDEDSMSAAEQSYRTNGILLALLPVASFIAQYLLSVRSGTQHALFHHLTVMVVDWAFVPFNFFVVRVIDWREGKKLYFIFCISVALNALTHAYWQYNGLDFGHMITSTGIFLPAGWVHLTFSTLEMVLLVAFVFCRNQQAPGLRLATAFAILYFITMGICGYLMHSGFIASDLIVFISGLFFVLVYPGLLRQKELRRSNS
jgi:hypothetical protein